MFDLIRDGVRRAGTARDPVRPFPDLCASSEPMSTDRIEADYLLETPLDPAEVVAAIMAGEQSSGTFVRVAGETDELRARAAAEVLEVDELGAGRGRPRSRAPSWSARASRARARRARVRIAFPVGQYRAQPAYAGRDGGRQSLRPRRGHRAEAAVASTCRQAYRPRYPHAGARHRRHAGAARASRTGRSSARSSSPMSACRRARSPIWSRRCARRASTSSRTTRSAPTRIMPRSPSACRR